MTIKKTSKLSAFFTILLLSSVFSLQAQAINLRGRVQNQSGNPVSGADVRLSEHTHISSSTSSNGYFELSGEITSVFAHNITRPTPSASLHGTELEIVLSKKSPVSITVYSVAGKMVYEFNAGKLNAGFNVVSLPLNRFGAGVYMIAVNHEENRSLFRYVSSVQSRAAITVSGDSASSMKIAQAAVDTLLVTADGYHSLSHPIAAYQQNNITITLETVSESRLENITRSCDGRMPSPVSGNQSGWASRYWDCCKPHCSWSDHTRKLAATCDINNNEITTAGTTSGCRSGGQAYTCYSHVPFAVCENLAYGFAAVPAGSDECGKCFKIQFDGGKHGPHAARHTERAIGGKMMIVMASNIGHDVDDDTGQFDLMIPGGGLGAFEGGCAVQWGVDAGEESLVGKRYGGFAGYCEGKLGPSTNWQFTMNDMKNCVRKMCNTLFDPEIYPERRDLWEGCIWYVDWMHAANNPTFTYQEVPCPQELIDLYYTSF